MRNLFVIIFVVYLLFCGFSCAVSLKGFEFNSGRIHIKF